VSFLKLTEATIYKLASTGEPIIVTNLTPHFGFLFKALLGVMPNNRNNSGWQLRCATLAADYAQRWAAIQPYKH
jgi:hypothetical protein